MEHCRFNDHDLTFRCPRLCQPNFFLISLLFFALNFLSFADEIPNDHPDLRTYRFDWIEEKCVIYVAEMDRNSEMLRFETAIANDQVVGKETVRSIVERRDRRGDGKVIVAINGGFGVLGDLRGYGGVLENLHVENGEPISQPIDTESCFGVTDDREFLIEPIRIAMKFNISNNEFSISAINQRRLRQNEIVLYTPKFDGSTHTSDRGFEIIADQLSLPITPKYKSSFRIVKFGSDGDNKIPKNGVIISFRKKPDRNFIKTLDQVKNGDLSISFDPPKWDQVRHAIGGRLRLVRNGEIDPKIKSAFNSKKKHTIGQRSESLILSYEPRTAIGFNDEKLFLIVADGRQPSYSTGLSLYRLAEFLIRIGATEAINLDGGSSSTMIVNGELINRPSGQGEREVLNSVLIIDRR